MNNLLILVLVSVLAFMYICRPSTEKFSTSGLAISDRYCDRLASTYYKPKVHCPKCKDHYGRRICGKQRRNTIDFKTGNYYTKNGMLV